MENRFAPAIPQLPVSDLVATRRFYRDVLGFRIDPVDGEHEYASVSRGAAVFHLYASDGAIPPHRIVLPAWDVDAVHADWKWKGAHECSEPEEKPWGVREFTARDNNGHRLVVRQRLRASLPAPREPLENVRIVKRLPTTGEYHALVEAVRWTEFVNYEAAARSLSRSLFCVVAELEGRCIGMARVAGDGALFFHVMDVAVLPEYQRRGVGTQLMNRLVEFIRNSAPEKALVGLFTGAAQSPFLERFGFRGPVAPLMGMTATSLEQV
ncbi:MAG TPA: GNAT family N-acetyltransferase [Opitutaceae bacterium]